MSVTLDVGVDLDGVGYHFTAAIARWINSATGKPLEEMPEAQRWDFFGEWGFETPEFFTLWTAGINAGVVYRQGEPYEGFVEMMEHLTGEGHRLHIVTARHTPGAEEMAEANTRAWLERWSVPHASLTFSSDKHVVETDVFLEDHVDNYDALEAAGRHPWLITRPWNAEHPARRVTSHAQFVSVVQRLAAAAA